MPTEISEQTGAAVAEGQSATPPDGAQAGQGQQPPQQPSSAQGSAPGQNRGSDDTATRGMLADLQKERKARQDLETRIATYEATQKRIQTAFAPEDPNAGNRQAILDALTQVSPALGKLAALDDAGIAKLFSALENQGVVTDTIQQMWENHSSTMLDEVFSAVEDELGGELNERQQKRLAAAYVQEAQNNPEFLARHQRGDRTLITAFVKDYLDDWREPIRRQVTRDAMSVNRRVPNGRDRSVRGTPTKVPNFTDNKETADAMVEQFLSGGGRFDK